MIRLLGPRAVLWMHIGAMIAVAGLGCNQNPAGYDDFAGRNRPTTAEELVEIPDGTTSELLELAKQSLAKTKLMGQKKPQADGDPKQEKQLREEFRVATLTGVRAADRVLADPQADEGQQAEARKAKLLLLYVGVKCDKLKFRHPFNSYAAKLAEQHAGSDVAVFAVAAQLELACLSKRASKNELLPKLVEHARRYPEHDSGVQLFDVFARQLMSRKDEAGAEECYRLGIDAYANHEHVGQLKEGMNLVQLAKVQRVSRRANVDAEERDIRRKLGHSDGYFVIYAEENVRPPRGGFMYFYHYEYEVLDGADSAVAYVKNLPETYSWRVERRYPDTSEGRRQAYELWKTLLNKKQKSS